MKKLMAILAMLCVVVALFSCSRTAEMRSGDEAKLARARAISQQSASSEFYKAKANLMEILATQPNHVEANQLLAELYFKQSEAVMNEMSDDVSLTQIEIIQNKRVILLKKALDHLERIHDQSPLKTQIEKELYIQE